MTAAQDFSDDTLRRALEAADLRVLLMVLFHMTGDEIWLSESFRPKRDVTLIADIGAGFDAERQAQIRAAAFDLLSARRPPVVEVPDEPLLHRMMMACMNEIIEPAYAGMMMEDMGFKSRFAAFTQPSLAQTVAKARGFRVGIVGAGVGGIILGANLARLGIDFVIYEQADDVGGTWRDHKYPGCSVDTPNHAYSFSFGSRFAWSRYFAPQAELQAYMQQAATEAQIRDHTRFNTEVVSASWDEAASQWRVGLRDGNGQREETVTVLISAIGQLSTPMRLPLKGEESFPGQIFHPMHWPEDLDLRGKRVAIVGSGASAMQIVPAIADQVGQLTIYQRTPQWMRPIPRYHDPIEPEQQWLLQKLPFYDRWFRFTMLWRYGDALLRSLKKDPNWPTPRLSVNAINERHRQEMLAYIESKLGSRPDLLAASVPQYPPYGKRILLDAGWYDALLRPNVELVSGVIREITGSQITASDGQTREADIIVVSTGYDVNSMTSLLNVTGRDGQRLEDLWQGDDPYAYLNTAVPGFPNMFIINGPNTGLAHGGSAIFMHECMSHYIAEFIVKMIEDDIASADVKPEAAAAYRDAVDTEHNSLVWTAEGLDSYYRNSRGRVTSANPWRMVDFWTKTKRADTENYQLVHATVPGRRAAG